MPLSIPLAPFRSRPLTKAMPRKQAVVAVLPDDEMAVGHVKATRKSVRFSSAACKPRLRVLRQATE